MSNKELFKQTFSELHASEDKVTEVIKMKGNKKIKHFPAKKLIAVAACIGTVLAAGIVANAATDGAIIDNIIWFVNSNGEKTPLTTNTEYDENGNKITTATGDGFQIKKSENNGDAEYSVDIDESSSSSGSGFYITDNGDGIIVRKDTNDNSYEITDGIDLDKYTKDGIYTDKNEKGQDVKITVEDNGNNKTCEVIE